ncbi:ATP-binding protein [Limosilactobacillus reuteri]|uniref:ATP-binding protein n=1 Tax=Limosilactobacillus reuteri TaxID=1598 RepID=UPI001E474450|nr:ATP-binding protein [Limosilactobacillus reuteri]MCC4412417.1 ATP-binding protein [Limosilactobacillus reuteri]MCC4412529.1 ATP-binding protein [Limosilactobacillus reuteri]
MTFKRVGFDIDPKLFERAGVNIHDPKLKELKEQRDKQMHNKFNRDLEQKRSSTVWSKSLWASGEIKFTLNEWKPEERSNPVKAKNLGNKAFKLAKEMVNGHLNVIMSGDAGVGKTSLALAMVNMLREAGKTALFVSTIALSELVSEQYEYSDRKMRLKELTRAMKTCDVLLLDDLGADGGSTEKVMGYGYTGTRKDLQALLFDVANNRYEGTEKERKAADKNHIKLIKPVHQTIITTNNLTDELIRIYGERTVSRLVTRDPNHRLAFNDMEDMRIKEGI